MFLSPSNLTAINYIFKKLTAFNVYPVLIIYILRMVRYILNVLGMRYVYYVNMRLVIDAV